MIQSRTSQEQASSADSKGRRLKLRTTPATMILQDDELFPAFTAKWREQRAPLFYYVQVGKTHVRITLVYFCVPEKIRANLEALEEQYFQWRRAQKLLHRWDEPRTGFDTVILLFVLRAHAAWWIDLLNQAAVFTLDPRTDAYKQDRRTGQ